MMWTWFILARTKISGASPASWSRILPILRDAPPALPFSWDEKTIRAGLNFTLTTTLGDLDLFGEISGGNTYKNLLPHSFTVDAFGIHFRCVDLPTLIRIKKAAGRAKDLEAIAELQALFEEGRS